MAISITIRWAGPSDAANGSTYLIEQTLDNNSWTTLDADQAATSPYVAPAAVLDGDVAYGAPALDLVSGTPISASGFGWLDDALVEWSGKTSNQLTGVTWHSGAGTYASGSAFLEAHESYVDASVTPTLNAVVYRITHTNPDSNMSAPTYIWYFYPPAPASSDHCVVIVNVATDLGVEAGAVSVQAYLKDDTQFGDMQGAHLNAGSSANKTQTTDDFGLACFQCWKSSRRGGIATGADAAYTFLLDALAAVQSTVLTVTVDSIPDRDWVLLKDVGRV
jgi:hypothetical protein